MMLTKDLNTLKLADFGMSKKMSLEERTQVVDFFYLEQSQWKLFSVSSVGNAKHINDFPSTDGA